MDSAVIETPAAPTPSAPPAESQAPAKVEGKPKANLIGSPDLVAEKQKRKAEKAEVWKAHLATIKADKTPAPAQPATPATTTQTAPGLPEDKAADSPTHKASEPAPKAEAKAKEITVMGRDKDGKEAEVKVSFDQAVNALLRDGMSHDDIKHLPDKSVLNLGSRKFLVQRDNDREWNRRNAQGRSEAGTNQTATPAAPAQAATPTGSSTPAAAAAQPIGSSQVQTPPTASETDADYQALVDQVGPDAAKSLIAIMSKRGTPAAAAPSTELEGLKTLHQNTVNMLLNDRFDNEFEASASDFPELVADGNEQLRSDIVANANAIASSGRFANPLERQTFKKIVREAIHSRLGEQKQENHARQLASRQRQQANGQPVAQPSREGKPAAALSLKDLKRKAMETYRTTGSIAEGQKIMRQGRSLPAG